jgi:hypothetical protein
MLTWDKLLGIDLSDFNTDSNQAEQSATGPGEWDKLALIEGQQNPFFTYSASQKKSKKTIVFSNPRFDSLTSSSELKLLNALFSYDNYFDIYLYDPKQPLANLTPIKSADEFLEKQKKAGPTSVASAAEVQSKMQNNDVLVIDHLLYENILNQLQEKQVPERHFDLTLLNATINSQDMQLLLKAVSPEQVESLALIAPTAEELKHIAVESATSDWVNQCLQYCSGLRLELKNPLFETEVIMPNPLPSVAIEINDTQSVQDINIPRNLDFVSLLTSIDWYYPLSPSLDQLPILPNLKRLGIANSTYLREIPWQQFPKLAELDIAALSKFSSQGIEQLSELESLILSL